MKPALFFLFTAILLVACGWFSSYLPPGDVFENVPAEQLLPLDGLYSSDVAALKLRHLRAVPAYDVLLLGNSRSLPVSAADLTPSQGRFFNMSLAGESFRSSILVLEELARSGRLPRTAIISFDHAELQYYGNPDWPGAWTRWRQAGRDLLAGISRRPAIGARDLARMALRHMQTEFKAVQRMFNFSRLRFGFCSLALPATACHDTRLAPRPAIHGYLQDGSRPQLPPAMPYADMTAKVPSAPPSILPGYLDYDLQRLRGIADQGTRIIVYESLLFPPMHRQAMQAPSSGASASRTALSAACARHGITCHAAPLQYDGRGMPWEDYHHPPSALLGAYIGRLAEAR